MSPRVPPSASVPGLVVIANPAAGRGRGQQVIAALEGVLARGAGGGIAVRVQLTTSPGAERALALAAARDGAGTILALGGDGTWGNVAQGILASGHAPRLALLAAGTGNDLAFATGLPVHDVEAALTIARGTAERRIDVGEVEGVRFLNCLGFGFDAEVVRATQRVRWLRGHAVYLVTAARQLLGYRGFEASISFDDDSAALAPPRRAAVLTHARSRHLALIVANGPRFGGGFLIAPHASIDDGRLDVVRIADGSPWRRLAVFSAATRGTHLAAPEVSSRPTGALTLTFDAPPIFQADGELHQAQTSTVVVRCTAGALRLAVAAQ